jgi:hypothetical protein
MKVLLTIIFLAGIGYGVYYFLDKEEYFEIKENINLSRSIEMDADAPLMQTPPSYMTIEGKITNISDKDFTGIVIIYKSGVDALKANIGNLKRGESYNFKSNSVRARNINPQYKLIDIIYNE